MNVPVDGAMFCRKCGDYPPTVRVEVVNIFRLREGHYVLWEADDAVRCGDCGDLLLSVAPEAFGIRLASGADDTHQRYK